MKKPRQSLKFGQLLDHVGNRCEKVRGEIGLWRAQRSERRTKEQQQYLDASQRLEEARQRFASLFWELYEEYEPDNKGALLDIPRMRFQQVVPLLEAELYRIAAILEPVFRRAEFDLGHEDRRIIKEMNAIWDEAQGNLQRKALAGIRLPIGLEWHGNQLTIEHQVWRRNGHSGPGYYGWLSNRFYGQRIVKLAP